MRLVYPAALVLLPLILLLIFTRRRQPHVRIQVGNLYLWKDVVPSDAPAVTRRLRRHWLLILQAAFLAAVAISIATPMLALDDRPIAVVLDTSVSMGARRDGMARIQLARARAVSLVEGMPRSTQVRLITADSEPRLLGEFRATDPSLGTAVGAVQTTDAAGDMRAAIQYARAGERPPRRIYVFSDGDASQVAGESDVEWSTIGQTADNAAITSVSTRRVPGRRATQLLVTAWNYGAATVNATVTLTRDGAELARSPVRLLPRASSSTSFTFPDIQGDPAPAFGNEGPPFGNGAAPGNVGAAFRRPSIVSARLGPPEGGLQVVDSENALRADDMRAVVVSPPARIRVLFVGRSYFLEKALSTHPEIELTRHPGPPEGGPSAEASYDLVVCDGCQSLPPGGNNVLFVPPRPPSLPEPVALVKASADHPVADALDLDGIRAVTLAGPGLVEGSTVVATGGGVPAVVAYEAAHRRVMELRLDPDAGGFPLSTAFPVLIANAVEWLAGGERNPVTLVAGNPLLWQLGPQRSQPTVVGQDDRPLASTFREGVLSFVQTQSAGTYRVRTDEGERVFVVNPAIRGESDLTIGSPDTSGVDSDTNEAAFAYKDATTLLLVLALLLLAFEWRYRLRAGPPSGARAPRLG